jgi:hypothetical protein
MGRQRMKLVEHSVSSASLMRFFVVSITKMGALKRSFLLEYLFDIALYSSACCNWYRFFAWSKRVFGIDTSTIIDKAPIFADFKVEISLGATSLHYENAAFQGARQDRLRSSKKSSICCKKTTLRDIDNTERNLALARAVYPLKRTSHATTFPCIF